MADIILAGDPGETFAGVGDVLEARQERFDRIEMEITDPGFCDKGMDGFPSVVISRFHEVDLASIKAMQQIKLRHPFVQMIFMTDKDLSASTLTLLFNEGAFGVLQEPLSADHAWQLVRQAIKRAKWELDNTARSEELGKINKGLRAKLDKVERELSIVSNLQDRMERFVHFLLSDKYFRPSGTRIMIVSSVAYQRNLLSEELAEMGFSVKDCDTASYAIDALGSYRPDIVVSDMELDQMSGVDLCKKVKGNPEHSSVYFVVVTSTPEKKDAILAPEAGVDDCVVKGAEAVKHYHISARIALGVLAR